MAVEVNQHAEGIHRLLIVSAQNQAVRPVEELLDRVEAVDAHIVGLLGVNLLPLILDGIAQGDAGTCQGLPLGLESSIGSAAAQGEHRNDQSQGQPAGDGRIGPVGFIDQDRLEQASNPSADQHGDIDDPHVVALRERISGPALEGGRQQADQAREDLIGQVDGEVGKQ